jgi:peptidoglycan hydrolase CwlO-like protein
MPNHEMHELPLDLETVTTAATGALIGLPALWLFFRHVLMKALAIDANADIISLMRAEIGRLQTRNVELSEKIDQLNQKIARLTDERDNALDRIAVMEREMGRLRQSLEQRGLFPSE